MKLRNITIALLIFFTITSIVQAHVYEKTSTIDYNTSGTQLSNILLNTSVVTAITAHVTTIYTENGPYDIPMNGLVGWWKLDNDATDSSGNGNHGTAKNNPSWTEGKYNNALLLNSDTSYIQLTDTAALDVENGKGATWSYIICPYTEASGAQSVWNYGGTMNGYINAGSQTFNIDYSTTSTASNYWTGLSYIPENEYTMITVVYKNETSIPTLNFYLNGVNITTRNLDSPLKHHTGTIKIAGSASSTLNGTIDNILLYNRSLTDEEIKRIYYDNVLDLRFKTNSNTTYSSSLSFSGDVSVPFGPSDTTISSILASVPSLVEIDGITVRDYSKTISPFTLTSLYQYTGNELVSSEPIIFTTINSTFAPSINVTGSPEVLWIFGDGSTSTSLEPNVNFGSEALRNNSLLVTPWSAVTQINLGYDGKDEGEDYNGNNVLLKPCQYVFAVYGLDNVRDSLEVFAAAYCPVTSLNFNDFTNLKSIECYCAGLTSISLNNTPSLERLCVESNFLETIDLTGSPSLLELRCAGQHNRLKQIIWMDEIKCWHICIHSNPSLESKVPIEKFNNVTELLTYDTNQTGEYKLHTKRLRLAWDGEGRENSWTSFNISGCVPANTNAYVYLSDCNYTHLDISDCKDINNLRAQNNSFNQTVVDKVLQDMYIESIVYDENPRYLWLYGNAAPSAAGIQAACGILDTAAADGDVCDLLIDIPADIIIVNELTRIMPNGTTANVTTGGRTLDNIYAAVKSDSSMVLDANNITFIPSNEINVILKQWNSTGKKWNESSEIITTVTHHIIGDFPADTPIQILRDGTNYEVVTSNETGYIDWTYSGGYSEHEFEAVAGEPSNFSAETQYTDMGSLSKFVKNTMSDGYILASLIVLAIGAVCLIIYFCFT